MEIIGIICEFNPLHNGHVYFINKIKELYPNSIIILVLNGYFLERGDISIESKEEKTRLALENNIDIVLELPALYGTMSADIFASTSLEILNNMHITKLIFGSESNDINTLTNLAKEELNNDFNIKVKEYLDKGYNYPSALSKSLNTNIKTPNDLLAISYIKAIIKNNYDIKPITIKRTNDYHDLISNDEIISASNIRNKLDNNINIDKYIPSNSNILNINYDLLFKLIKYKIITEDNLSQYETVDEGIENKLKKEIYKSNNIDELIHNIKSKRYTYNRLKRMLIHILLGIKSQDTNIKLEYIRLLGFNNKGKLYLHNIKTNIPIITKYRNIDSKIKLYEDRASYIYSLVTNIDTYTYENNNKPIIYK